MALCHTLHRKVNSFFLVFKISNMMLFDWRLVFEIISLFWVAQWDWTLWVSYPWSCYSYSELEKWCICVLVIYVKIKLKFINGPIEVSIQCLLWTFSILITWILLTKQVTHSFFVSRFTMLLICRTEMLHILRFEIICRIISMRHTLKLLDENVASFMVRIWLMEV